MCSSTQIEVLCFPRVQVLFTTAFQSSECSSVMAESKPCADSTEHGRKCSLVASKELGYSALKHKHLEVITVFVGGKDLFMVDSQLGSGNSLWYGYLPIVFDLLLGKERVIFCGTCSVNNLK